MKTTAEERKDWYLLGVAHERTRDLLDDFTEMERLVEGLTDTLRVVMKVSDTGKIDTAEALVIQDARRWLDDHPK